MTCLSNLWAGWMRAGLICALSVQSSWSSPQTANEPGPVDSLSAADQAGIRAAHDAACHAARPAETGYLVRNPGQRCSTEFDGRGFTTRPAAGGWSWGLELVRYGFAERSIDVTGSECIDAEGSRVSYQRCAELEEWFVNDARGLEHGFTLASRPACDAGAAALEFTLAVRGALEPRAQADGRGVDFLAAAGSTVLTYSGLTVLDADGSELPARLEVVPAGLRLSVFEQGARYPLTIDPLVQLAYLKASNSENLDLFGRAVAISGNTVLVGALGEDSNATGVNGNQYNFLGANSGAAYVFVRVGDVWSQQAYLKAPAVAPHSQFGVVLALSGDTAVIGQPLEDSDAVGVNGNPHGSGAPWSGAAHVFVRNGTTWSQQAYLKASNPDDLDVFGCAVAVDGDRIVVGARFESSDSTGVNGSQTSNTMDRAGAAYVFVRSGTDWVQEAYLKASNTGLRDEFGTSVSISGDTIVVGAPGEDSASVGVNGNQLDDGALYSGAAYVFVRGAGGWAQEAYLKASNTDAGDLFGWSAAIDGDTVALGAKFEASSATGVNGNQFDNGAPQAGAAYVFVRSGTTWAQQAYLKALGVDWLDWMGDCLALSGDRLIVGVPYDDSASTGTNGNPGDNSGYETGAAYLYMRSGSTWSTAAYLKASNTDDEDAFGLAVAIDGVLMVVGAPDEDSLATGVNGNQGDNGSPSSGAAYVFDVEGPGTPFCTQTKPTSVAGCTASLSVSDTALDTGSWDTTDIPRSAAAAGGTTLGIYIYSHGVGLGQSTFNATFSFGNLCIQGFKRSTPACAPVTLFTQPGVCNAGLMSLSPACSGGALGLAVGDDVNVQLWYRDPGAAADANFSNAVFYTLQ